MSAREKIAWSIMKEIDESAMDAGAVESAVDAILANLPDIVREMIPDLKWRKYDTGSRFAHVLGIYYQIKVDGDGLVLWRHEGDSQAGMGFSPEDPDILMELANAHSKDQIIKSMGLGE